MRVGHLGGQQRTIGVHSREPAAVDGVAQRPVEQGIDAVLGERLAGTGSFNRAYLQHLVDAHQNGTRDYSAPLWTLLMFEAFLRNVVDGSATQPHSVDEPMAAPVLS